MINRLIKYSYYSQSRFGLKICKIGFAVSILIGLQVLPSAASVPPMISQFVGVDHSIVNELGQPLVGTDPFSSEFGIPVVEGALIQIMMVTDGIVYPPELNGEPDSRNIVLSTTRIGLGVSPALARSGMFSSLLAPRPSGGVKIFVRVFNASSLEEASFYGDSEVFTVSSLENKTFMASVSATDKPLDSLDSDNDGLSNSQEGSMGTDPYTADSDGDDYSDADELVAGTDSLNEDSYPQLTSIQYAGPGLTRVEWWPNVSGRTYRIYFKNNLEDDESGMILATTVASTGVDNSVVLTNSSLPNTGSFVFRVSK